MGKSRHLVMRRAGFLLVVALWLEQSVFNIVRCNLHWSAYWRLVLIVALPTLILLGARRSHAAVAAALGQLAVVGWFNVTACPLGERTGESGIVGGLGALYTIIFGYLATVVLGGAGYLLDRRRATRAAT